MLDVWSKQIGRSATGRQMTIHDTKDLRVTLDDDAVSLYLFDTHVVTMTLAEWKQINTALEGLKE